MKKIKVSIPFAIAFGIMVFFDQEGRLVSIFAAAMLHELGHIICMAWRRVDVRLVEVRLFGAHIQYGGGLSSYWDDILIAISGCAANAICVIVCYILGKVGMGANLAFFCGVNMAFMLFNALPCMPLDGGRVLYAAIAQFGSVTLAEQVLLLTTLVMGFTSFGVGVIIWNATRQNFSLIFVSAIILLGVYRKYKFVSGE